MEHLICVTNPAESSIEMNYMCFLHQVIEGPIRILTTLAEIVHLISSPNSTDSAAGAIHSRSNQAGIENQNKALELLQISESSKPFLNEVIDMVKEVFGEG
jgi:hypothetical protein